MESESTRRSDEAQRAAWLCGCWTLRSRILLLCLLIGTTASAQDIGAPDRDAAASSHAPPPNLVLFLVDDYGWQDSSVPFWTEPTPQNRHYFTPNLARLAAQGVRFTHAAACTVCSPTRTSLLTGWNAARHRVTNWTLFPDQETSAETASLAAPRNWRRAGYQPGDDTLPSLLRFRFGYRTIHVGKAHWGAQGTPGEDPCALGFDVNIGGHAAGAPGHYHGEQNYGNQPQDPARAHWGVPGLEAYHGTGTHLTDALTQEAIRAVEAAVHERQPFYLYLAHYAVHTPLQPHARFLSRYRNRNYPGTEIPIPEVEATYASMVEGMDASLGQLMDALHRLGVAENTLIVFLSDNGGLSRHARGTGPRGLNRDSHNWPLREGKGSAYEGGTRIPMVMAWAKPGDAPPQHRLPLPQQAIESAPVIVEDLFPTLLSVAAQGQGNRDLPQRDGYDLTQLFGPAAAHHAHLLRDRPLVFHYPHQWHGPIEGGYQPHSAIRVGDWKAIYFYESQRWELYHLSTDVGEAQNLAATHPDHLQKLAQQLAELLAERGACWPWQRELEQDEPLRTPADIAFPAATWEPVSPVEAGISEESLAEVAAYLNGRGAIVYDGRLLHTWGDATQAGDVASAVKPWFAHFLAQAVADGKLSSFEEPLVKFVPELATLNAGLGHKDRLITFRHAASQTSCYGVSERPGEAFDYNDFQMALFCDTLFTKVWNVSWSHVDREILGPRLTNVLQCEDHPSLLAMGDAERAGRLRISPRDFCRFGLLYLHDGAWRNQPILPPEFARTLTRSPLPPSLPRTQAVAAELLPDQRTLGSARIPDDQTDHFGCYSWSWWVNGVRPSGDRFWPAAPVDTIACLGHKHGMRGMAVIPSWKLVLSWNDSTLAERPWDNQANAPHPLNVVFQRLKPGRTVE